jgi:hypothetical protein
MIHTSPGVRLVRGLEGWPRCSPAWVTSSIPKAGKAGRAAAAPQWRATSSRAQASGRARAESKKGLQGGARAGSVNIGSARRLQQEGMCGSGPVGRPQGCRQPREDGRRQDGLGERVRGAQCAVRWLSFAGAGVTVHLCGVLHSSAYGAGCAAETGRMSVQICRMQGWGHVRSPQTASSP